MQHYTVLRLLLAGFFLYIAWPYIPQAVLRIELIFWGIWVSLFLLVVGGNLSTLLRMTEPPVMEQDRIRERSNP